MEFAPLVAAAALVLKVLDFVKALKNQDSNAIVTQLGVWIAGVGVIFLLGSTDFASGVEVAGYTLDSLNAWSLVFLGLTVGSTGSLIFDFKKSFDNTDSSRQEPLLPPPLPPRAP